MPALPVREALPPKRARLCGLLVLRRVHLGEVLDERPLPGALAFGAADALVYLAELEHALELVPAFLTGELVDRFPGVGQRVGRRPRFGERLRIVDGVLEVHRVLVGLQ